MNLSLGSEVCSVSTLLFLNFMGTCFWSFRIHVTVTNPFNHNSLVLLPKYLC